MNHLTAGLLLTASTGAAFLTNPTPGAQRTVPSTHSLPQRPGGVLMRYPRISGLDGVSLTKGGSILKSVPQTSMNRLLPSHLREVAPVSLLTLMAKLEPTEEGDDEPPESDLDLKTILKNREQMRDLLEQLNEALNQIDSQRFGKTDEDTEVIDTVAESCDDANGKNATVPSADSERPNCGAGKDCWFEKSRNVTDSEIEQNESKKLTVKSSGSDIRNDMMMKLMSEMFSSVHNGTKFENPLPGIEIGIPLNIFAELFTYLHYGENVLTSKDLFLQFCIGYFTYGLDRLLDAEEFENEGGDNVDGKVDEKKVALYNMINENRENVIAGVTASGLYVLNELAQTPETRLFIPALATTLFYKELKSQFGPMKPFYLAAMWTVATVILPCVMHDGNFSILNSPMDYLPAALLLFGTTNFADSKDMEEDKEKGVQTLPLVLGKEVTKILSASSLLLCVAMIMDKLISMQ